MKLLFLLRLKFPLEGWQIISNFRKFEIPGKSREILNMDIHGEFSFEHAKAVGEPYAGYGPAPIRDLDPQKLKIERKSHWTLPEGSVEVLNCIARLLLI